MVTKELTEMACDFLHLVRSMRECSHVSETHRVESFKVNVTTRFFTDGKVDHICAKHSEKKQFSSHNSYESL